MATPMFCVSQFTSWHQTFEEDVELYAALGVPGIEVCERKLSTDSGEARQQLQLLKAKGLTVTSVQPRCHALFKDGMCPELDDPKERLTRYRQSIDLFSDVFPGENLPLVTISGGAPDFNFRHAYETARHLYPKLADYAADRGVRIMFEPLSPILMNIDTFICTLDGAMQLIDAVDRDNFGLMLDVWHLWNEPNIAERIARLDGNRIFGVHIGDWPRERPRHFADRVLPGDGVINLPALLAAIEAAGYHGAYCLEIFSLDALPDSLWQQNPAEMIRRGWQGFEHAWEARLCS